MVSKLVEGDRKNWRHLDGHTNRLEAIAKVGDLQAATNA